MDSMATPDILQHSENIDEELQRIKFALQTVFSPPHVLKQGESTFLHHDQANRYLVSFQCLPIAWMVCDQLLLQEHDESNCYFFAAQTLHFKCREEVYIAQLPQDSLVSLRDSLISHLIRFAMNPPSGALITRLCMAIASLSVHMRWYSIVNDVLENVKVRPELAPVILELIQLIPEETCSRRLYLPNEKMRHEFRESLCSFSQSTLSFLAEMSNASVNISQQERILRCFHSWIRNVNIPPLLIQNTPLLDTAFQVLMDPNSSAFEFAVDVVVEILRAYGCEPRSYVGLVHKMIPLVMQLGSTVFPKAVQDQDEDAMRGYCRIFTETGESYMSLILSYEDMNQNKLVELILNCACVPNHDIANITLNFWYHFVTSLETLEPYEYRQDRTDYYNSILLKFVHICISMMKYPQDLDELLDDQVEDLERDRRYVGESVDDCCRLLGGDLVLNIIGERIRKEALDFQSLSPDEQMKNWQGVEAAIFSLQSVAQYIPSDENYVLPFVMQLLNSFPTSLKRLRFTANITIGNYATWLGKHPQYLTSLLPFLAQGLHASLGCASSSATAIKYICKNCTQQPLGDAVLQLYEGIVSATNYSNAGMGHSCPIDLKDELQVLEGTCVAVSLQLEYNPNTVSSYMNRIVYPILERLKALVAPNNDCNAKQVVSEIERLTVIVRFMDPPPVSDEEKYDEDGDEQSSRFKFIIPLMSEAWNSLDAAAKKFPMDPNVAEKLCRLHKHALRGCGQHYIPLLNSLMETLVVNFQQSFLSPYLYAASICIADFSHNPNLVRGLYDMISHLSLTVFSKLKSLEDFIAHPDVVEEFFYLLGRCMSHCPNPFVTSDLMNSSLQCAIVGMHVEHRDSNKGILTFIEHTVSYGINITLDSLSNNSDTVSQSCKAALEKVIMHEGQALVTNLAKGITGELPTYSHSLNSGSVSITGIIYQMNDLCPEPLLQWMNEALKQAPDPARSEFLKVLMQKASKEEFIMKLTNLKELCERSRKLMQNSGAFHFR